MFSSKDCRWKLSVFLIYIILLGIAISRHEPWFDEAQAWLLARDSSILDLFTKYMRYEGSPGLWHLILSIPAKLQLPYAALNILSGAIAAGGVYLFLQYSPFPNYIKVLYPFSFFAFYQYAVVARSYVLLPLILFATAMAYKNKETHPYPYIFFICLLANVSMHGFIIALGLAFVHFLDQLGIWRHLDSTVKRKQIISFIAFAVVVLAVVFELRPASDLISFAAYNHDLNFFYPRTVVMFRDSLSSNISSPDADKTAFSDFSFFFSGAVIVLSLLWFQLRKKLMTFLMPICGLGLLFTVIYANVWHQGTMFLTWLFVMWISFEHSEKEDTFTIKTRNVMALSLAVILSLQVYWAFSSFSYDLNHNYSASREAANYIKKNHLENKKIYITGFHSISILPYFPNNIFCNFNQGHKPSFWLWSSKNSMYTEPYLSFSSYQPDFIIFGMKNYCNNKTFTDDAPIPSVPGYALSKVFYGSLYWKDKPYETDSFLLFEKIGNNPIPSSNQK